MLIGEKVHGLSDDTKLHGLQVLGTLRHYHYVGAVLSIEGLAQTSSRQELVVDNQTMIVYKQDIYAWLDITMLEGIVEKDNIDIFHCLTVCKATNAVDTVFVYCHCYVAKLLLHLHRLVANEACRG